MSNEQDITSEEHFQRLPVEDQARARNALYFLVTHLASGEYGRARLLNSLYSRLVRQDIHPTHARALLDFLQGGGRGLDIRDRDASALAKAAGCRFSLPH